jgi:hypothetical protein
MTIPFLKYSILLTFLVLGIPLFHFKNSVLNHSSKHEKISLTDQQEKLKLLADPQLVQAFSKILKRENRKNAEVENFNIHKMHFLPSTLHDLIEFSEFEVNMAKRLSLTSTYEDKLLFSLFLCAKRKSEHQRFGILYETLKKEALPKREQISAIAQSFQDEEAQDLFPNELRTMHEVLLSQGGHWP